MEHKSCAGCRHDLGGGRDNCRLNLAYECRDGGGFEAWEAGEPEEDARGPERGQGTEPQCGQSVFLIFFGLSCALIGAIVYRYAVLFF